MTIYTSTKGLHLESDKTYLIAYDRHPGHREFKNLIFSSVQYQGIQGSSLLKFVSPLTGIETVLLERDIVTAVKQTEE
jgi:hypothetical protein